MNANHVRELGLATLSGSLAFPEIVGKLMAEGVEYYHVDYVTLQINFYSDEDGVVQVPLSFENMPAVNKDFAAPDLKAAIVDSQKNGQAFRDFSHRAIRAGVMGYFVFLRGQRVTYFGRQGDQHTEWFSGTQPATSTVVPPI